jgi:hypothetical protein
MNWNGSGSTALRACLRFWQLWRKGKPVHLARACASLPHRLIITGANGHEMVARASFYLSIWREDLLTGAIYTILFVSGLSPNHINSIIMYTVGTTNDYWGWESEAVSKQREAIVGRIDRIDRTWPNGKKRDVYNRAGDLCQVEELYNRENSYYLLEYGHMPEWNIGYLLRLLYYELHTHDFTGLLNGCHHSLSYADETLDYLNYKSMEEFAPIVMYWYGELKWTPQFTWNGFTQTSTKKVSWIAYKAWPVFCVSTGCRKQNQQQF